MEVVLEVKKERQEDEHLLSAAVQRQFDGCSFCVLRTKIDRLEWVYARWKCLLWGEKRVWGTTCNQPTMEKRGVNSQSTVWTNKKN